MKKEYQFRLTHRKKQHMWYTESLIDVLNQLDEVNAYKDTQRYHALLSDSHWLRSKIDMLHQDIEYLENKIRGVK